MRGHHVYDKGASLPKPSTEPLSYEEGVRLIDFLEARTWAMKGSGSLLAGWAVCSFLAGSMPFRPHIWINAPANTGKTFLRDDLIPLFGGGAIAPDGAESTEAGIRRDLGSSTLPVIWDEMEQDAGDKGKQNNINKVQAQGESVLATLSESLNIETSLSWHTVGARKACPSLHRRSKQGGNKPPRDHLHQREAQ